MKIRNSEDLDTLISDIITNTSKELLIKDNSEHKRHSIADLKPCTLNNACKKIIKCHKIEVN